MSETGNASSTIASLDQEVVYCPECKRYSQKNKSTCPYCQATNLRIIRSQALPARQVYRCPVCHVHYLDSFQLDAPCRQCSSDSVEYLPFPQEGMDPAYDLCSDCGAIEASSSSSSSSSHPCPSCQAGPLVPLNPNTLAGPTSEGSTGSHGTGLTFSSMEERIRVLTRFFQLIFREHYSTGRELPELPSTQDTIPLRLPLPSAWTSPSAREGEEEWARLQRPERLTDTNDMVRYLCVDLGLNAQLQPSHPTGAPASSPSGGGRTGMGNRGNRWRRDRSNRQFVPLGAHVHENLSSSGSRYPEDSSTEGLHSRTRSADDAAAASSNAPPTQRPAIATLMEGLLGVTGLWGPQRTPSSTSTSQDNSSSRANPTHPAPPPPPPNFGSSSGTQPTSGFTAYGTTFFPGPGAQPQVFTFNPQRDGNFADFLSNTLQQIIASPYTGPWGDYVMDGTSLDDVITRIMEQASSSSRSNGVSEERINRIPWHTILPEQDATPEGHLPDCPICKEDFLPEERVRQLEECHHQYHDECIRPWLLQSATCPVCRREVKEDNDYDAGESSSSSTSHLPDQEPLD